MKKRLFILASFLAVGLLLPVYGLADTFNAPLTDDATVFQLVPTLNYGSYPDLGVGWVPGSPHSQERQAYLKFNLTGLAGIDPNNISSVKLSLHVFTLPNNAAPPYDQYQGSVVAYHSPDTWVQSGITWGNKPSLSGEPLMGTSPTLFPNDLTYEINLLTNGKSWLAGDLSDHYLSVAVLLPDNNLSNGDYYFCSSEYNRNGCVSPTLEIQYTTSTVPEPATMLLLGLGIAGLAGVRRFRK